MYILHTNLYTFHNIKYICIKFLCKGKNNIYIQKYIHKYVQIHIHTYIRRINTYLHTYSKTKNNFQNLYKFMISICFISLSLFYYINLILLFI